MDTRTMVRERLRRSRDWAATIDELDKELEQKGTKVDQSNALFDLAAISEDVIPERERALGLYQRAWKLHPDNLKALSRAREIYGELGRYEMVAKLGEMELRSPAAQPGLAAIVGEALLDCGLKDKAQPVLARAIERTPDSVRVKDALAALDYDAEFWLDEVERLTTEADKFDAPTAARMILRAARMLRLETPDDPMLEQTLRKVLARDIDEPSANFMLETILAQATRWDDLFAHHQARAATITDPTRRADRERRFGLEWVQRFKDRDRGAAFFAQALRTAAEHGVPMRTLPAAFAVVRQVFVDKGDAAKVLDLADSLVNQLAVDDLLYVASQAGLIAWKTSKDVARARAFFQRAASVDAQQPDAMDFDKAEGLGQAETLVAAAARTRSATAAPAPAVPAPVAAPAPIVEAAPPPVVPEKTPAPAPAPAPAPVVEAPRAAKPTAAPAPRKEELPADLEGAMEAARKAEGGPDKGVATWKEVVAKNPSVQAPRRELARVLRKAEAWSQLADALKDEEAKAAVTPAEKAAVFRELAEAYGKLNNENQVVSALSQSLAQDGNQPAIYDQLAGIYENKKRWPDLVKLLGEKAERQDDNEAKVGIYLQIANLYLEKFSNQAEAIKAFERVLELDPQNGQAIEHLLAVYEKRRDWEKLIKLKENEIERTPEHERGAKVIEVARMAQTKVKKPEVCTFWWEKVVEFEPTHEEALSELYKLYERNKDWAKLADVSAKQADIAPDDKARVEALQRLGLLYTEKVEDSAKAIDAWQRLLAVDENNRRAQDALKKLYVTEGRWQELEDFYRSRGKTDEYVRVLEREVEAGPEQHRLALATKIAELYRDELGKPDRAMRAYEKVLTLDESNLNAAEALIPLYESAKDPKKLVGVLEIQLAATSKDEVGLRQDRIKKIAEYSEEKLRDKGAAFGWWLKAHAEDHRAEWIRTELERLAGETGSWQALVDAYATSRQKFVADGADKRDALPLLLVMARVHETELADTDKALALSREILDLDDANEQALDSLERLYISKGRFQELLDIYTKKLDLTADGDQRLAIQTKIGQLYEDEVKDDAKAIAAYQAIVDAAGDHPGALRALDRIYLRNKQWKELSDVIGRQLTVIGPDGDDKAAWLELKYRLGQLRETHLSDVGGAIDAYRDILDVDPSHAPARAALEARLAASAENAPHQLAAAAILEPIYEQLGEWGKLVQVHEIQLAAEKDSLARVALLLKIGELERGKQTDPDRAFAAYARAFKEDPSTGSAREQLEALAPLVDDGWAKLVALLEAPIADASAANIDPALRHELATKVARTYEDRLGNSAAAVEAFRKALSIEPDDVAALTALEAIFSRDGKHGELLEVFRRRAEITSDAGERLGFLFRIAQIQEEELKAPDEAIAAYGDVLGQDPDNVAALRALDRLFTQRQRWQDLGDNLTRQLTLASDGDGERVTLLARLAALRETHLGELAAAVETYRQVLDTDDTSAPAKTAQDSAVTALERLLASAAPGQPGAATVGEQELAIATILEPIYKNGGLWQKQIGVYEVMARHAFDPIRKIELLHQIAELHELGGDDAAAAFATHARALKEDPRNEVTQGQLDRLARQLGKHAEMVALYDQITAEAGEEDLKVALLVKQAQTHERETGDAAAAVATYERVMQVAPGNVDALSAIQAIHERTSNWPALVGALRRKSELLLDVPERKALLFRAAQIEEDVLTNPDAAIATYRQILAIDDVDMTAMDALERLYVRLERWNDLKDVYGKKAELAEDPDDKKRMLYVLAQVYDRELGDVGKAIETYQAVLDIDAAEVPAVQSLDRLYGAAERWYDLLGNLERQVELAHESGGAPGELVALKYRIGHLWQTRLGDVSRAIESYREALEIDPGHAETIAALDGLVASAAEPVPAARVLEPIYEASAEHAKLANVLEVITKHTEDPHARVELLHRIASLSEYQLDNTRAAFDAYARALRDDSGNEQTLGHIERLADAAKTWPELAALYTAEADKTMDIPRQVDLWSRLARVHEQELGNVEAAIATYKRILDAEFDNRPAVLALDRLYTQTQRHAELTEILRREIQLAEADGAGEQVGLDLQYRLGQTLEHALGDRKAAVEVYREILVNAPTHAPTLVALEQMFAAGHLQSEVATVLEPLYETAGEYEKLHGIYQVQLGKLAGPDRPGMFQRLAELAEGKLYDQGRAFQWWGEAVVEDPRNEAAVEEVERLARETGGWSELVGVYGAAIERHASAPNAGELHRQTLLRMARVYESELADPANAVGTHIRVLDIEPKDEAALAALDRLYLGAGMYDELVEILRRRIEVTQDGDEQLELYFRRGAIYADALGDLDAALGCYQAVLAQESRNRRALECMEGIYFRRQEWQKLHETYEQLVDVADGDDELADIYARMAKLSSEALDQQDRAIDLWGRVLDIRGDEAGALSSLGELYARANRWEEWIEVMERQVSVVQTDRDQIALYKAMGQVWEGKLGRERNALDAWLAADRIDGRDLETLNALAHLYRSTQSWDELSQTLSRIIEVGGETGAVNEDQRIELYAQLGQLEGDVLGRVDHAVEAWRNVIALDPSDFRALAALESLFTREGRWEEAIEVLEKRALVLDDEAARTETLLQAAATWEEKVENLTEAASVYERVRRSDSANVIASERLEAIYRAQYKWTELNEVLLERVENRSSVPEQIEILGNVAKIYETELGDQESAFYVLQAAFKRDYAHEGTARELERLATATNRWQELLDEYTARVNELETENRVAAADLWVKVGRWYGEHLSHVDWAIHSVQQALRIDPAHPGGLAALAELQRKRGAWSELGESLQRLAAAEPTPARRTEVFVQLGELLELQMQDLPGAINAYQQAVTNDPTSKPALVALDRLYRRSEMWEPLIDVLGRRAALETEEREASRLRLEIGQIWDLRMYDAGSAIRAYQAVLDADPQSLPALRALEQLYEKTGQSEKYLEVLEAQLDASPSDAERVSLYERMAAAWEERFGKLDRAAEAYEKIVAIDGRNFGAYRELARLYQQAGRADALVETYRNHIMATADVATRIDLYVAMGAAYETQLGDVDRAVEAYTDVLSFDGEEPRALDALGRLYEKMAEWDRAVDITSQLVRITDDPRKQVELYARMGRIQYGQLHDVESAEANFLRGLAVDNAHVATMEALVKLYSDRGDWLKAAQMMVRAESYTPVVLDKVRLLNDAAHIYQDRLRQPEAAKQLYAAVIALDPEHVDAGRPLAELYFQAKEWPQLSPVIDMLVRKVAQSHPDPRELNELYFRAAKTADELGENDKALSYYKSSYELDPSYLPTLMGRADLLYKLGEWDAAGKIYQTLLVQNRDGAAESDVVRIYYRLGMVRQQLNERKKALNMFEKALELDPTHRDTLTAVIDLQTAAGDWEAVVGAKRGLLATSAPKDQIQVLSEIGAIYKDKLANPQKSIGAYLEAVEIAPEDPALLQKVLDLYEETKQWKKVVETIERFIQLTVDPVRKGAYCHAAGTICRDELKSLDEAVDYYTRALDNFFADPNKLSAQMLPRALKSFEAIDRILTTKRDWKAQERAYREMIKRVKDGDEGMFGKVRVGLFDALGEIYRTRLKHFESAISALEVAQTMDPENPDRGEKLAELYLVAGPDHADKAVAQHMRMLRAEPFKYDSYKALRRIYMDAHQYDKTWCLCNTLAFLKKADAEELQFFEQYKPRGLVKAKNIISPDSWNKLVHPEENRYISAVFAAVWQGIAAMKAFPHKDAGVKRKDKRNLQTDQLMFSKLFYYVAQVLALPLPEVFLIEDGKQTDIQLANFVEKDQLIPSFVVRPNLLQGKNERETAFLSARRLTFMRPEYYLKLLLPTNTELKVAFLSAIKLVQPGFPIPPDAAQLVAQYLPEMQKRLPPQVAEHLAVVVQRFLQAAPEVNLAKWGHAVDAASQRAGFVLCGDLETAARLISAEPVTVGGPQVKDKIKEMVLFSISEEYFAVRAQMGLTIG